jgi:hypothetical protein
VTRFSAKTDSGVSSAATRSTNIVPRIEMPPTSIGSSAATRPRKSTSESRNSSGKASISARARSLEIWSEICTLVNTGPPTLTPAAPASCASMRRAAS